ncbi:MAG TPA: dynamin family protein, partial [Acidimicrobiales bacterium]
GRVKAGKSTLLNALVGERLAPTDAGECTKIVTWYERAAQYRVEADMVDGTREALPFRRTEGALHIDLGGHDAASVSELHVGWPTSTLGVLTLIDTPGLASLNDENSARTHEFLADRSEGPSDADAVIFLMRHVHRVDLAFLDAFMDRSVTGASPVHAVAVLSRSDEIGACRLDAMESSARIAERYRNDPEVRALCATVVPIAGLIAETGLTLREDEAAALRRLAATDPADLDLMLLSADQLCDVSVSDLTVEVRRGLLDRLGMFGVRFAIEAVRTGRAASAAALSTLLVEQSGLPELRRVIAEQFLPRATSLKARSGLAALRRLSAELAAVDPGLADRVAREAERIETGTADFARLRAAHLVASRTVEVEDDAEDLQRLLLGETAAGALGLEADADADAIRSGALAAISRWRNRAGDPLAEPAAVEVYEAAARTCEGFFARAG